MSNSEKFESRILALTDEVVAWDKPPGLATTGRTMGDQDCAQGWAIEWAGKTVWALHQLDRQTSGVVLFARKKSAVSRWQSRWGSGGIQKSYLALVHGRLAAESVTIDAPLKKMSGRGQTRMRVGAEGKPAETQLQQLSTNGSYSFVLATPMTGRTHQIRVHLQVAGCPLIGERRYNSIPCGHHHRHCLHAYALRCDEAPPLDRLVAPIPEDLRDVAERMGIDLGALTSLR